MTEHMKKVVVVRYWSPEKAFSNKSIDEAIAVLRDMQDNTPGFAGFTNWMFKGWNYNTLTVTAERPETPNEEKARISRSAKEKIRKENKRLKDLIKKKQILAKLQKEIKQLEG